MNLFDSHAHYNDEKFDNDRKEIIEKTLKNGVSNFIVAGYNIESSKKALNIVKDYPYFEQQRAHIYKVYTNIFLENQDFNRYFKYAKIYLNTVAYDYNFNATYI